MGMRKGGFVRVGVGVTVVFLGSLTPKSPWQSMWRGVILMLADTDSSLVSPRGRQQQQVGRGGRMSFPESSGSSLSVYALPVYTK